jgi:hypothetical protein
MPLSAKARKNLMVAVADQDAGNEIATAIDNGLAGSFEGFATVTAVVATSTSTTTNFSGLLVGDLVMILPAVAGNAQFVTCATVGTLPQAAVVGSLYIVMRAVPAVNATTSYIKF